MEDTIKSMVWNPTNLKALIKLTELTTNPGIVYPLNIKDAPENFTRMPGASLYYVSAYPKPIVEGRVTIGGEMLIGRTEEDTVKNYLYYFATSSDNSVYFAGPYFQFPGHHIESTAPMKVEEMFGHGPLAKRTKP